MLKKILFVFTALLLATLPSLAQQDTGVITGEVLDESGAPIANASVEVKNTGTGIVSRVSDRRGRFLHYAAPSHRDLFGNGGSEGLQTRHPRRPDIERSGPVARLFHSGIGDVQQSVEVWAKLPFSSRSLRPWAR